MTRYNETEAQRADRKNRVNALLHTRSQERQGLGHGAYKPDGYMKPKAVERFVRMRERERTVAAICEEERQQEIADHGQFGVGS